MAACVPVGWAIAACRVLARHGVAAGPAWHVLCFTDTCCLVPLRRLGGPDDEFDLSPNRALVGRTPCWRDRVCTRVCLWVDDGARFRLVMCDASRLVAGIGQRGLRHTDCTELRTRGREKTASRYFFSFGTPCALLRRVTLADDPVMPRALPLYTPVSTVPAAQRVDRHLRRARGLLAQYLARTKAVWDAST